MVLTIISDNRVQALQKVEGVGKTKANKLYDFLRLKATTGLKKSLPRDSNPRPAHYE